MTKIYLADPEINTNQLDAINNTLPEGWSLIDTPEGANAILTEKVDVTAEMLAAAAPDLRIILRLDTGNAAVAPTALPIRDISNTGMIGVAEHVVAFVLALSRQLLWVARKTAAAEWVPGRDEPILTSARKYTFNWVGLPQSGALYFKTVGIVGLGHIGQAVARRLKPFGVRIYYTDLQRFDPEFEAELGVEWRSLDDLLRESDFVTLHLRYIEGPDGNEHFFSTPQFELMKPTAYIINTARGRLMDEEALIAALKTKKIAGAGLDVFRYEPLPKDHPLLELASDNVILSAHCSGTVMPEAWQTIADEIVYRVRNALGNGQ